MATTEYEFSVPAPELFAALVEPDTYPHWLVGARRIRMVSGSWPQPRSYFEHTVGFGPIAIADRTTVRDVDEPRMLELLVRARPALEAVVRFEVEASPTGCTLRMEETPIGVYKALSAIAQPLIRARNERSMRRLRGFIERQAAASPANGGVAQGAASDHVPHRTGAGQALDNAENESPA